MLKNATSTDATCKQSLINCETRGPGGHCQFCGGNMMKTVTWSKGKDREGTIWCVALQTQKTDMQRQDTSQETKIQQPRGSNKEKGLIALKT